MGHIQAFERVHAGGGKCSCTLTNLGLLWLDTHAVRIAHSPPSSQLLRWAGYWLPRH